MNVKQKKKRTMNIDVIIANAARLNKKEAQAVVDYLESIKFADKKPPSSVVKTKLKGFVGGDEEKIKMLFKAPEPNDLKAKEVKTEQISATQQYKAVKDMLKVPEDATVDQVVKAFSEKANCSEEQARNFIADLRSEHTSTDAYQTMMTMMKGGKKIGDSKPPEAIDESGLDIDNVIDESEKKIFVEGKGDGDVSGRVDTEKIPKPEVSEEVEEIAPPEDERATTVMPAPEIEKKVEQPLEPISLTSIEDQAQEAEPPGKTRQIEAPKLDAPEKLPDTAVPLLKPDDLSQSAEPPGMTQKVKAVSPDILEINEKAEKVKEILLIHGTKLSHINERIPGATNTVIDEGIKRYAAELLQRGLERETIKKKLVKKGIDMLDADAALIVLNDDGEERISRISKIPVASKDVIGEREIGESQLDLQAPPPIKKKEEKEKKEEKREITEELDAPDIEEMESPKEKEEKKEKKEKSKPPPPPPKKKEKEEKEEVKSEEEKEGDGKDHGPLSTARTRKSVTPDMLKPELLEREFEDSVVTAGDDISKQVDKKSAEKKDKDKEEEDRVGEVGTESIEIDFSAPEEKPVVPRPSSPFKTVVGSDFEGDELIAANGTKDGRISLLGPEQQDDEITDVLVVKHALPVAKLIGEKSNMKDILGALKYEYKLKEERKIAKAVYDGALYYARHELEKETDESKKAKKEDEIKERLKAVGYRRRDIKRVLRETPIMVVRSKARQKKATPWTQKLSERQKRALKWTGVVTGIATGVVGLMAGTAVLTYKMVMGDAAQQKPVKDKQEQIDEQKPEKAQKTVEIFMSEIPVKEDAAEEQVEDVVSTEEKPAEPIKTDEPLVETQPKPVETAEGPKEDEVNVSNGGKTIEKPLIIKEEGKGKGGATDDLDDIFGGK